MFFLGSLLSVSIIGLIPVLILIFSWIDKLRGKREKTNWKWSGILFAGILIIYFGLSIYYKGKYDFPIFPNKSDAIIILIIAGVLFAIIGGICLFTYLSLRGRNLPKSVHNPKIFPIISLGTPIFFLYIGLLLLPLAGKINFASSIERAMEMIENDRNDTEFTIVLSKSDKQCVRSRSSSCSDDEYENFFFVKNNLDKAQEVQVEIRAYGADKKVQKEINSTIMKLEPGEVKLITTEETWEDSSPWNQWTFQTDKRVGYYEYMYRYRDVR